MTARAPAAYGHGESTLDETIVGGDKAEAFQFLRVAKRIGCTKRRDTVRVRLRR